MPLSIPHPPSDPGDLAESFRSFEHTPAHIPLPKISRHMIDPHRLQPLLPPWPCPHNRRRSDHLRPTVEPTKASLHLTWNTVKQTVAHVLGGA